jgi:hypothetical protein
MLPGKGPTDRIAVSTRNGLTLLVSRRKSNLMEGRSGTRYGYLRNILGEPNVFQEDSVTPPEALLQAIWQHQRLHRNKLRTADGRPVFILHPGFLNREAGPDFRRAVIQFGDDSPQSGDVEVDPRTADWIHHRHGSNPAYARVLLHVVWQAGSRSFSPAHVPLLEIKPALDAPLATLQAGLMYQSTSMIPPHVAGRCAGPLHELDPARVETLLRDAGGFRLRSRASRMEARARECGWTQALWEGLFRALGYKQNTWPMLRLAELRTRLESGGPSRMEILARLLGVSGLLPAELPKTNASTARYVRTLWDGWWRERDRFAALTFPRSVWRLSGIRPANHPQRRLVVAAAWMHQGTLPRRLAAWCDIVPRDSRLLPSLLNVLAPTPDRFWATHATLRSPGADPPLRLLGPDRVTDLAVNIVLPWLWARARQGNREAVCAELERRYLAWPRGADNAILRMARKRLLGDRRIPLPRRAALQQGLLQIVRDYCDQANSLCEGCRFPEVARRFTAG